MAVELFPCGVLLQRTWLIAWSRTAEGACWARANIAASVKEGATREKVRAFGRLAPIATRDAAGLPNQPQRTRQMLEMWPQDEPHPHKLAFTTAKLTSPSPYRLPEPVSLATQDSQRKTLCPVYSTLRRIKYGAQPQARRTSCEWRHRRPRASQIGLGGLPAQGGVTEKIGGR